jgi:CheY-like chemotaxis protein
MRAPSQDNRDQITRETLVPASVATRTICGADAIFGKAFIMMVQDQLTVPTVVLVVEDEMLLRMRAVDMVEDAGYTPVEAIDADQAVKILESRSDIALMFTDIQMPGSMDGLGLAHAVRERWPPIKIIVVSGALKLPDIEIPADSRFFGKPLQAETMIAEMRNMIGDG